VNDTPLLPSRAPGAPAGRPWRESLFSAARFWERRRFVYNLVLTVLVIVLVVDNWSHFRPAFTLPAFFLAFAYLLFLATLANLCYCAAYPVDLALQRSATPVILRRGRAVLWWAGMVFAFLLAWYWIVDEVMAA
jgi:hypothetical protein